MNESRTFKTLFVEAIEDTDHKDSVLFVGQIPLDEIPRKGEEFIHSYQQFEVTNFVRDYDKGDFEVKVIVKNLGKPITRGIY